MPSCRRGWCTAKRVSNVLFSKYLLYTNLGLSVTLTALGDFAEQKIMHYKVPWDENRTTRVVIVGGVFGGYVSHWWFNYLEKKIPGQSFKSVMKKVWLDQLVFSPLYTLFLFVALDVLEQISFEDIKHGVKEKASLLIFSEILFMPPLQAMNFYFIVPKYRVMFDYVLSLMLSMFTSFIKYDF
ncbi:mpv17-like protein 2 [Cimex lectularius]|uniref:Mpv17-like protein n=1 Tax=Cimex lectularius TaxID=79782 RepID=A0A8I6RSI8_CIMLE|nr:mpv17-like protein 2 [Cimex lectularius]